MTVEKVLNRNFLTISAFEGRAAIEDKLAREKFLVVMDNNNYEGLLINADLIYRPHKLVIDCLSEKPKVDFYDSIENTIAIMDQYSLHILPVFKNNDFIGVVTYQSLLNELYLQNVKNKVKIEESEKNYKLLFEKMRSGFILAEIFMNSKTQINDIKIVNVNPAFEEMAKLRKNNLIGLSLKKIFINIEPFVNIALRQGSSNMTFFNETLNKHLEISAFSTRENQIAVMVVDISDRINNEKIINDALEEKKELIREIQHRVRNNMQIILSFLHLNRMHINDPKYDEFCTKCINRVHSVALVHEHILEGNKLDQIDMQWYFTNLVSHFKQFNNKQNNNDIVVSNRKTVFLDMDRAIYCGMLVNEIIENLLQNTVSRLKIRKIEISFITTENNYQLEIVDNSAQIIDQAVYSQSFNFELMNMLIEQLKGNMQTISENGIIYKVLFK